MTSNIAFAVASLALIIGFAGVVMPLDYTIEDYASYQKLLTGNIANRPIANITDRWFYAIDEGIMYYDNSTYWTEINYTQQSDFDNLTSYFDTHRHWKNRQTVYKAETSEEECSSESYIRLMETSYKDWYIANILIVSFTHNVKCEGELATRGASFRFGYETNGGSPSWFPIVVMRWTDGLDDYKMMSGSFIVSVGNGNFRFVVDWLVDDTLYSCWSKNRYLHVQSFQQGGNIP